MNWPRYTAKPACRWCRDFRAMLDNFGQVISCKECGSLDEGGYAAYRKERHKALAPRPEITQLDLDAEEFAEYNRLAKLHPGVSGLTVLSWMEGRRYKPSEDAEFMADVEQRMELWRAEQRRKAEEIGRSWDDEYESVPVRKRAA